MHKRFDKIKILGLITATFLISCTQEATPGASSFDNFTAFAAMNNYSSPLFDNTTLHLADNGSIMSNDNTFVIYNYVEQIEGDNSRAIYNAKLPTDTGAKVPKAVDDRLFIVKVNGTGNSKYLEFQYDTSISGGFYWNYEEDINLTDTISDNISPKQVGFLDIAPKTRYVYPKNNAYINLLQTGTIVYYHDEDIIIFDIVDQGGLALNRSRYKAKERNNSYLGVEVVGEGDNKDLKFYFDKKGNKDDESVFWTEYQSINFDEANANADVFPETFVDNARKFGYQFALENNGANIHDNGTITNSTDTKALFTFESQPSLADNTKAVYKEVNSGKLVGIQITGNTYDDKKLEIYFKNKNNIAQFWDHPEHVKHVDNDTSVLATRSVGMEGGTAQVVSTKTLVANSEISTLVADNVTYVLSQTGVNDIMLSYTTDISDTPKWDSSITTGYKVMSSSLQSKGKDIFATVTDSLDNLVTLKLKPGLAPVNLSDNGNYIDAKRNAKANVKAVVNGFVTTTDNNTLYVASSAGEETTITGGQYTFIHDQDIVQTIVVKGNELFTAGLTTQGGNKFSVSTSYLDVKPPSDTGASDYYGKDITGTGLPTVTDIKTDTISLAYADGKLYAVTTVNGVVDIYLYNSNRTTPKWTKQSLPTITGVDSSDAQLISEVDNLYFLRKQGTDIVMTPLRIREDGSLATFAGGATSITIPSSNSNIKAGITIVDNSDKVKAVNKDTFGAEPDKALPTGDIYLSYVSAYGKLEVKKINMKDDGVFELPTATP